jgi:hypothetical protein
MRGALGPSGERYHDRFVRETARRVYFLMAMAARYGEPARFIEDLRRALCAARREVAGP